MKQPPSLSQLTTGTTHVIGIYPVVVQGLLNINPVPQPPNNKPAVPYTPFLGPTKPYYY